jgi:hypothetical protein
MASKPFSERVGKSGRPQIMLNIDDGELLYRDEKYGNAYATVMEELIAVFQERVAVSKAGDLTLETDSPEIMERQDELLQKLQEMYSDLRFAPGATAEGKVSEWRQKLFDAAAAIKPEYDKWEKAQISAMEGP